MEQKRTKKIILLVIALIMLILGMLVYTYVTTDFLKTPQQLFNKYLINSVTLISEFNTEPYGTVIKRSNEEPIEFTANLETTIKPHYSTRYIWGNDKFNLSTTAVLKSDIKNKNSDLSINIKNNEQDFYSIKLLKTKDIYGVKIPDIHEKYIAVENTNLKDIAQTLELDQAIIDNIPETIPDTSENFITEEEVNKLLELSLKYVDKILEQLDETALYTKQTFRIANFDGDYIKGKKYILTISKVDFHNIVTNIFKELMNEQELLELLEEKIDQDTIANLKKQVKEAKLLETDENAENVIISICEYKGKTLRIIYEEATGKKVEITGINKETSSHLVAKITVPKSENNDVGYDTTFDLKNVYEDNNGQSTLKLKKTYNKKDLSSIKNSNFSSIFSSILGSNDTEKEIKNLQSYKDTDITFNLTTTANENKINSTIDFDGFEFVQDSSNLKLSLTTKVGSNIKLSKLTHKNAIIINNYSKEDFTNLQTEMANNMKKNAIENPNSLIGILNNAINLYISSLSTIDATEIEERFLQEEISEFNGQFEAFKGEMNGPDVKTLLSRLIANYVSYEEEPEKIPDVLFENTTASYSLGKETYIDGISKIREEIQSKAFYNIDFTYDEIGFIDVITITKIDNLVE